MSKGEVMQQPVRRAVGRPATESERLKAVEELAAFVKKYAPGAFERLEGDGFPVRKVAGGPHARRL
jgi:hypothetical protein